jgi:hypothetical protein
MAHMVHLAGADLALAQAEAVHFHHEPQV